MRGMVKCSTLFALWLLGAILLLGLNLVATPQGAQASKVDPAVFKKVAWRNIGPCIMGGRMTDIEAVPGNPDVVYFGTASSGLWKSTNGGVTVEPIFDGQSVHSIGDLALAPSNPELIWLGTGESNARNTISFGDGVYKSTDGGKTWKHMGLEDTQIISRVLIHPTNPDIAYVAAVGHAYGPNKERGVFMTTDGGKTWEKVLYIDEETGASDLDMDPSNPNILYAGMWTFQRKPWTMRSGSEKGGVYKSVDGGRTWKKLTNGLPKLIGRIGIKVAPSNPNVVYAITESLEGTMFRSDDRGEIWQRMTNEWGIIFRGFYYADMRVDPQNENRIYAISGGLSRSIDAGRTWERIAGSVHGDHHTLWIDPFNPKILYDGNDGGIGISRDGGDNWEYLKTMPLAQYYQITFDNQVPFYMVYGGLQDNGSWGGPAKNRSTSGILNDDWFRIGGGDGFFTVVHPEKPYLMLNDAHGGNIQRVDIRTRQSQSVNPYPVPILGGPIGDHPYRFDWGAPIAGSPHDPDTVYFGSNVLFKSTDFGTSWEEISPDLTTNDPEKLKSSGGPILPDNTSAEFHCIILWIAESPVKAGVIWVGTDDGLVQVTQDGGKNWTNVTKNIRGLPPDGLTSHVEASRTGASVAYVSADRHQLDDFKPYVFKTTDFGKSWTNITGNLPATGHVHVVREDPHNPKVLYVGTEIGIFVSFTGGNNWVPLKMQNLPTVAVHDILVQPDENDLVIGTHGRSVWIADDIHFIQQTSQAVDSDVYLFDLRKAWRHSRASTKTSTGEKAFSGPNPEYGALVTYYLKTAPDEKTPVKIQILDSQGSLVRELKGTKHAGVNRVAWNLSYEPSVPRNPRGEVPVRRFRVPSGPQALPGEYTVKLMVGNKTQTKSLRVALDPALEVTESDLRTAFNKAMELRELVSSLNLALRALDGIELQVKNLQETIQQGMGEAPAPVSRALNDMLKKVDTLRRTMVRHGVSSYDAPSKLLSKLSRLSSSIDGANAAPTPHQLEYLEKFKVEHREAIQKTNSLLARDLPELNQVLQQHNIPPLMGAKPIE